MLNGLRDLFLSALKFDGRDAMPLINQWNEEIARVEKHIEDREKEIRFQYETAMKR